MKSENVFGVKELKEFLDKKIPEHANSILSATIHAVASDIVKDARANAPVNSGILKKSIFAKRDRAPKGKPTSSVRVKKDGFYWRFIEKGRNGTKGTVAARPFIQPAIDRAKQNFSENLQKHFVKKLREKARREARKRF